MNTPVIARAAVPVTPEFAQLVPVDKKLDPAWLDSLTRRGKPERFSGEDLRFIGMPVGGLFCGTVYLSGDGRLWLWDIFNAGELGVFPQGGWYQGKFLDPMAGAAYVSPGLADQHRVLKQGFTLSVETATGKFTRTVDADRATGFPAVTFTGEYPIGVVTYDDPALPVNVKLQAFSPFIPLNADDSSLPATIFDFTITNNGSEPARIALTGFLENAVLRAHPEWITERCNEIRRADGLTFLSCFVAAKPDEPSTRPDLPFEDWSQENYAATGWKAEGDAFGSGPIFKKDLPAHQGEVGGDTERVINSFATAPGETMDEKDAGVGKLTSRPFRIERSFINLWISGGNFPETVKVSVIVDGKVVRSVTGNANNRLTDRALDVREFQGREATLEIVDQQKSSWGWIGVGRIWLSDRRPDKEQTVQLPDFGSMGLALLGAPAEIEESVAKASAGEGVVGSLGRRFQLAPGESAQVRFVVTWHFPNVSNILGGRRRHYAARFADAHAVAQFVADNFERLSTQTYLWRDTWYDSTLPYWFLNRTFANTSTLATTTCHRFDDGRFWAWEGVGSCPGTCTHVWHYAQAVGRLFPEIERDQRERVDFGLALHDGIVYFRAEDSPPNYRFAVDGQAGRILGAYREHQMSADDGFLRRIWPKVKSALQYIIHLDADRSGILHGPLHNTLDADWYGIVPWLCGLYHAALRAGEEMAKEIGDAEFAATCRSILEVTQQNLDAICWNKDFGYYIHRRDEAHPHEVGAYDGCHIDQVLGQGWAWQVGLGRVMTESHVKTALASLWTYNFVPNVGPYRAVKTAGRWYAIEGDAGLLMMTHPFTAETGFTGPGAFFALYFNECMSGFEHQAASHMIWEGMVTEGLAITRAIHDRYRPAMRNPYNEIECSDHYGRAMASYGTFLAAGGFEYHGPHGHLGFAPRVTPEHFRTPFTVAEGWGTYEQIVTKEKFSASIVLKSGRLKLKTLAFALPDGAASSSLKATFNGMSVAATIAVSGLRAIVTFTSGLLLSTGSKLQVMISHPGT